MFNYTKELILNDFSPVKVLTGATSAPTSGVSWDPGIPTGRKALFIEKFSKYIVGADVATLMSAPGKPAGTPSITGGNIAASTVYYVITALAGTGETSKSVESDAVVIGGTTNGSVVLTWTPVPGATAYKVYRTTTSGNYSTNAYVGISLSNTFTDTVAAASLGSDVPPTTGTAYIISGALSAETKDYIKDSTVYKRAYSAPINAVAGVTVPTTVSGTLYRLSVQLVTSNYAEAQFARDRVLYGKPFYVEVLGTGTAATDAATLIANWNAATSTYTNFPVASSGGGALVTLTATIPEMAFKSVLIESLDLTTGIATTVATGSTTTPNSLPFGNYDDLIRNHRLPTLENFRPFGLNQDELPIMGATYDQYSFEYMADRGVMDQSFMGGTGTSKVNIVIWVNKSAAAVTRHISGTVGQTGSYTFEQILNATGLVIKNAATKAVVPVTPVTES